uniref:inactive rhomboid protein 1-like isoform X3 n=1 Tax=Myxine glutinosa TaxID=7769 RepID=UPI00358F7210
MSETVKPTRLQRQKPQGLSINVPGNRSPAHRQQGKKRSLFQRSSLSTETEQAPLSAANRPMFSRQTSLRKSIKRGTADWFGVGDNEAGQQERWQQRSRRHCNMRLGPLKPQYMKELEQAHQRWQRIRQNWVQGEAADDECALTSPTSPNDVPSSFSHQRRQSVARMSYDAATSLARKYSFKESGFKRTPSSRRTFVRATPAQKHPPDLEDRLDVSFFTKDDSSGQAQKKDKPGQNLQAYRPIAQDKSSKQQDMTYVQAGIPRTGKAKSAHLGIKGKSRGCRIPEIMQRIAFRQEKRAYGLGMVGRLLHRAYRPQLDNKTWKQLQEVDQHRPYFTYWLTVVHILITLFSVCTYGIAPIGFAQHEEIENILNHKGQHVIATYIQQQNFWIGPSSETLIHLGAKFAPCMRQDTQVAEGIADSRNYEAGSGCCVRNDGSGCVQMQRKACSEVLSTWYRWPEHDPPLFINGKNRTSGPVCGQDPRTCEEPASAVPHEWPDNITQWPICTKPVQANHTGFPQMDCTVTGHPCCIGTKGVRSRHGNTAISWTATSITKQVYAHRYTACGMFAACFPSSTKMCLINFIACGSLYSCMLGGASRISLGHHGVPFCRAVPELADPATSLVCTYQTAFHPDCAFCFRPLALGRQLCPDLWLRKWLALVFRHAAIRCFWSLRSLQEEVSNHCDASHIRGSPSGAHHLVLHTTDALQLV